MIEIQTIGSSSKGNGYIINDGVSSLLIECGLPLKQIQKATNFKLTSLVGCLISHEHGDHAKAAKDLIGRGMNLYASKGTFESLGISNHRAKVLEPKKEIQIGSWKVLPFDVQHDAAEPLGFLIMNNIGEKLIFLTDTYYCKYKFNGITHLMIECNYSLDILNENIKSGRTPAAMKNRLLHSHFGLETVKDFLKANDISQVVEIHLIHLSDSNSDAERFKREIATLTGKPVYISSQ